MYAFYFHGKKKKKRKSVNRTELVSERTEKRKKKKKQRILGPWEHGGIPVRETGAPICLRYISLIAATSGSAHINSVLSQIH